MVFCDRCKTMRYDAFIEINVSGGCYDLSSGFWKQFARPYLISGHPVELISGEKQMEGKICDECMFADPRYVEIYGVIR